MGGQYLRRVAPFTGRSGNGFRRVAIILIVYTMIVNVNNMDWRFVLVSALRRHVGATVGLTRLNGNPSQRANILLCQQ